MNNTVTIALSKTKLIKNTIVSLVFLVAGVLFVARPFWFIKSNDTLIITIVGYIAIVFAGLLLIFYVKKLTDKTPGLVIDDEGILDNSSAIAAGKIRWSDIKRINAEMVSGQQFIMVEVKNPQGYIQAQKNPLKKNLMSLNYKLYKTPLYITSVGLNTTFENLFSIIENGFQNYKR